MEAYDGEADLACHASKGRTPRTEVLYSAGGVWYVYLVYGMHHMLNLVTGPEDYPAAVLIRGLESVSGPGRLSKALGIDLDLNRSPAKNPPRTPPPRPMAVRASRRSSAKTTPRIGIIPCRAGLVGQTVANSASRSCPEPPPAMNPTGPRNSAARRKADLRRGFFLCTAEELIMAMPVVTMSLPVNVFLTALVTQAFPLSNSAIGLFSSVPLSPISADISGRLAAVAPEGYPRR